VEQFSGKYVVITGAGSGISRETAVVFAERGAKGIIIADINLEGATNAAQEISTVVGFNCIPFKVDVSSPTSIEALFAFADEKFSRVDILVNGAGIISRTPMEKLDAAAWDKTLNINLRGTYLCAREAFKFMKEQKYGKIVNIASLVGRIGATMSAVDYVASKGGVISLTYGLARLGAPYNINVNGVAPGVINTPMTKDSSYPPSTKIGQSRDVANLIAFLASDDSKHINGCTIDINGGKYMH